MQKTYTIKLIFCEKLWIWIGYTDLDWAKDISIYYLILSYIFNIKNRIILLFLKGQFIILFFYYKAEYMV